MARGDILVRLLGDSSDLERKFRIAGQKLGGIGGRIGGIGVTLSKTLTPAAGAAAAAFGGIAHSFHDGANSIRTETGATGKKLDELVDAARNVAGKVVEPFSQVGDVLGLIAARTDLPTAKIKELAQQVLELSHITGTDARVNAESMIDVLNRWNIPADKVATTMDRLFRISQATGAPVADIASSVGKFATTFQGLGLGLTDAAVLVGELEKRGVPAVQTLTGLRNALGTLSKDAKDKVPPAFKGMADAWHQIEGKINTKDVAGAFVLLKNAISDANSDAQARAIAIQFFGKKAGPDLAAALRQGTIATGDLAKKVGAGGDSIHKAAKDTQTLGDKIAILKNKVVAAVGPFSQQAAVAATIVSGIPPLVAGITALAGAEGVAAAASRLMALAMDSLPFVAIAAAVILLVILIAKNWSKIKEWTTRIFHAVAKFVRDRFNDIKKIVKGVVDWIKHNWPLLLAILTGPIGLAVLFIIKHFKQISDTVKKVVGWVKDRWNDFIGFFKKLPGRIASIAVGMWDGVKKAFKGVINFLIRAWNKLDFGIHIHVPHWVPVIGGKGFDVKDIFPDIPYLASGGVVTRPTVAMIGEAGPEAVVPLNNANWRRTQSVYHINVTVPVGAHKGVVGKEIVEYIRAYEKANGPVWLKSR